MIYGIEKCIILKRTGEAQPHNRDNRDVMYNVAMYSVSCPVGYNLAQIF